MNSENSASQCIRCGRCMSVCPVYQTTFREDDVARGRLAILEKDDGAGFGRSRRLNDILSRCLMCGACAHACVNHVQTTQKIQQGRQSLSLACRGMHGSRSMDRILVKSLREGGISGQVMTKGGALLESLFCQKIPQGSGLHLRFPLSFFTKRSFIPKIAWVPFLKRPFEQRKKERKKRVAFFVGCGANYLFPEAATALMNILDIMGVAVEVPSDQGCCGLPAYVSGDTERARALAKTNLEAFKGLDVDAVITVCASCGAHLEYMGQHFQNDPVLGRYGQLWAKKHRDAMTYLLEDLALDEFLGDLPMHSQGAVSEKLISYHDPCHLRIAQGQTEAPRSLLESLPGVTLKDPPHGGRCCGHGGDFNLSHFDVSMKILDRRMEDFRKVGPDVITTGCTGCLLQLEEGAGRLGLHGKVRVCHPLVLMAQAMVGGKGIAKVGS